MGALDFARLLEIAESERQSGLADPYAELVLDEAHIDSPGWLTFLGALNPLETLRQYLNDRHEHRKDHEYREADEARKADLENAMLEMDVIGKWLQILRDLGATEEDIAPIRRRLILDPLAVLGTHQDSGLLEGPSG